MTDEAENGASLLVVDDNPENRDLLVRRLHKHGYRVETAATGEAALARLEAEGIDLVLLDIGMPGIGGVEVLSRLREKQPAARLPIIMVTARSDNSDVVECLGRGANDYVTKPVDMPVLLARIRTHLSIRKTEELLRVSEERYAVAARGSNDGLWDWDLKSDLLRFSPRWRAMLGYEEAEIVGRIAGWSARVHPEEVASWESAIQGHLRGESPLLVHEHRIRHVEGHYLWFQARGLAVRDSEGNAQRMAGSIRDITSGKVTDPLTGLPNRLLFTDRLSRALERARRHPDQGLGVLFLDLDQFKIINDSLGHIAGDELLMEVAVCIESVIRSTDTVTRIGSGSTVARFGGDEFILLLEDLETTGDALKVAKRVQEGLNSRIVLNGQKVFVSASIGIVADVRGYTRPEEVLRDADTAMYQAKNAGRAGSVVFGPEMRKRAVDRLSLETELRRAEERQQLSLVYQPIVDLLTGRPVAMEALIRWHHPTRGNISPAEFIPVAEETGIINSMGQWALEEACVQASAWSRHPGAGEGIRISINVSGRQFAQPDLPTALREVLDRTGLKPGSMILEITESVALEDVRRTRRILNQVKALGIRVAIDDFGTGVSSLGQLRRYPVDILKIDRSFISGSSAEAPDPAIVSTILELGRRLGMEVVAEGVENATQETFLRSLECRYVQGFYYSHPLQARDVETFVASFAQKKDRAGHLVQSERRSA